MAWKASWAHRTGENEKKDNDKIKKSVQTMSACGQMRLFRNIKSSIGGVLATMTSHYTLNKIEV